MYLYLQQLSRVHVLYAFHSTISQDTIYECNYSQTSFCLADDSTNEAFHSPANFFPISAEITLKKYTQANHFTTAITAHIHMYIYIYIYVDIKSVHIPLHV